MRSTSSRRSLRPRALVALLAVPLIVVPAVASFAVSGEGGARPTMARGSFHPVAGTFEPDETTLEECGGEWTCLEQAFGNLAYREGPKPALALFEERLEADPNVETDCHRIVHMIGSGAFERFDGNVARTFAQGSPTCVSGYYHGILERAFAGISSKAELREAARSLCRGANLRRRGFLDYQCRHGLGHGLMIQTGYDLPLALSVCRALGTGWDHKACASGAFMENINTRFGFRSRWLDDEDPLYPCRRVRKADQRSCYLRSSWRFLELSGFDWSAAAEGCARLGAWTTTCFHGYGRDAAEVARYGRAKILSLCRIAGAGQAECLRGAARTVANAWGKPGVAPAAALCDRAPGAAGTACFSGVGLVLGMLYPNEASRRRACLRLTHEHVDACAAAARAEVDPSGRESWG